MLEQQKQPGRERKREKSLKSTVSYIYEKNPETQNQDYVLNSLCITFWIDFIRVEVTYKTLDTEMSNHYMSLWEHTDDWNCRVVRLNFSRGKQSPAEQSW